MPAVAGLARTRRRTPAATSGRSAAVSRIRPASSSAPGDRQVLVPDVEGAGGQAGRGGIQAVVLRAAGTVVAAAAGRAYARADGGRPARLEQRRPLLEHPLVVGADPGVPGRGGDQQLVEEPPALLRVALDQGQVLGREQHRAQHAEHLPGPRHRGPVEPGPVRPAGVDLDLHQAVAVGGGDRGAQDRPARAPAPDQRRVGRHPVAAEGGDVADRLDQVGLALPVRRRSSVLTPGSRLSSAAGVGPEVGEREAGQVHTGGYPRRQLPGRVVSRALGTTSDRAVRGRFMGVWTGCGDGVAAELVAQGGDDLHRRGVVLPGGEPGEQRGA